MRARLSFSHALIFSLLFHFIILGLISWTGLLTATKVRQEQVIELELAIDIVPQQFTQPNASSLVLPVAAASTGMEHAEQKKNQPAPAISEIQEKSSSSVSFAGYSVANDINRSGNTITNSASSTPGAGKLSPPRILRKVDLLYPEEVRRRGGAGTVILKVEVLETGRPGNISVQQSSNDTALNEAAVQAVQQWQFIPAKDEQTGLAVRCFITLPIVFKLE